MLLLHNGEGRMGTYGLKSGETQAQSDIVARKTTVVCWSRTGGKEADLCHAQCKLARFTSSGCRQIPLPGAPLLQVSFRFRLARDLTNRNTAARDQETDEPRASRSRRRQRSHHRAPSVRRLPNCFPTPLKPSSASPHPLTFLDKRTQCIHTGAEAVHPKLLPTCSARNVLNEISTSFAS